VFIVVAVFASVAVAIVVVAFVVAIVNSKIWFA
jgi:hypothetical protein